MDVLKLPVAQDSVQQNLQSKQDGSIETSRLVDYPVLKTEDISNTKKKEKINNLKSKVVKYENNNKIKNNDNDNIKSPFYMIN
jgi:hemerythrin superfamily protein